MAFIVILLVCWMRGKSRKKMLIQIKLTSSSYSLVQVSISHFQMLQCACLLHNRLRIIYSHYKCFILYFLLREYGSLNTNIHSVSIPFITPFVFYIIIFCFLSPLLAVVCVASISKQELLQYG